MTCDISVVISTRNDPVGTLVTVRSIIEEFKYDGFTGEIIVVDNSDIQLKWKTTQDLLDSNLDVVKIYKQPFQCLFSARDMGVAKSSGKYVLIVDSHCLFYYKTIKNMLDFASLQNNLGMLFGLVCYSKVHHEDAFCDRDVERSLPIRLCAYPNHEEAFKIPLRSMPYMITKDLYTKMRGYWPLSKHKLVWGGGDYLISFKPMLLGYDNWLLTTAGVIHLGPFNDGGHFAGSFLKTASPIYPRFVGMLTAAYVIGGQELLETRLKQLMNRIKDEKEAERLRQKATFFGEEERRWIIKNQSRTYNQICEIFKGKQGNKDVRKHEIENLLPEPGEYIFPKVYSFVPAVQQRPIPIDNWRSRINQDRSNFKQSFG